MKKRILNTVFIFGLIIETTAQTDVDALRYSGSSTTGTARFTAMSGAFGALGGDFSSIAQNPAGIAIYRSSEFTFTPSINVGKTSSTFLGNNSDERKYNFNIGNVGLVYTRILPDNGNSSGWKSWNFGIGYNRLTGFHNRTYYEGLNTSNSLLDRFAENATGNDPADLDPYNEYLAYNSYMINPDPNLVYSGVIPDGQEIQQRSSESRGAIGETIIVFGGNYSNKLYIGGALGLKNLRYVESSTYEETDPDTAIPYFSRLKFQQDLTTRGVGVDLKFGMIYRVSDFFRMGVAVETPTWYTMHDIYKTSLTGKLDTGSVRTFNSESPDGEFDYEFTSPFLASASMAFVIKTQGLISIDYQFSDYGESRFDASGISFSDVNSLILKKYKETHTIRIGTEWLYQNFAFRGGYSMSTSPFNSSYAVSGSDFARTGISAGIGYREDNLFLDLGYARIQSNEFYQPYTLSTEEVPGVKNKVVTSNFTFTFGVKF